MPRIKNIQAAFSGGAVAANFEGRIDLDAYYKSARDIENCYIDNIGAAFRREGQAYIDNTTTNQKPRFIEFEFNTEQEYLLVFTPGEFKVYTNDIVTATVTSAPIDALTADIIEEMDFVQSADTLIIVHPDIPPFTITRSSDTVFTAANITLVDVPQFNFPDTAGSGTDEVQRIEYTIGSTNEGSFRLNLEGEVSDGITIRSSDNAADRALKIQTALRNMAITSDTGIVVSTTADANIHDITFSGDDGDFDWTTLTVQDRTGFDSFAIAETTKGGPPLEDVWSSTRGYPGSVTFFEGRLWFGGSRSRPQTIWGSVINDFFNFNVGTGLDNQAIDITIDDDQVNAITSIISGRTLQIFTTGGEFALLKEFDTPVTPTNIVLRKQTRHGSNDVRPVTIDGTTLFTEASGNVVREFVFNEVEQSFTAPNVSVFTDYIRNVTRAAVRRSVDDASVSYTYYVNGDGTVAVLNKLNEQNLRAFTLFTTDGTYEDVAVVGSDVYFAVKRTIGGSDVRFIEKMDRSKLLDASVRVEEASDTTSFSGFDHLDDNPVFVLAALDTTSLLSPLNENTVTSGSITTEFPVRTVEVGLAFFAKVETLPVEVNPGGGLTAGDYKRLVYATPRLVDSRQVIIQAGRSTFKPSFRNFGSGVLDQPVPLFTGSLKTYISGVAREVTVTITQDVPLEFTVLAVTIGVSV